MRHWGASACGEAGEPAVECLQEGLAKPPQPGTIIHSSALQAIAACLHIPFVYHSIAY